MLLLCCYASLYLFLHPLRCTVAREGLASCQPEVFRSALQAKKQEIRDVQDEFQQEKEDMLEQIRTLTQQIKLKDLVIASFIPPDYQQKIMQFCHWSDYEESWAIEGLEYTGNFVRARKEKELAQQKDRDTEDGLGDGVVAVRPFARRPSSSMPREGLIACLFPCSGIPGHAPSILPTLFVLCS